MTKQNTKKEGSFMSYLTQNLLHLTSKCGAAANEFLQKKIEEGVNVVLKAELAGFLGW